MKRKTELTSSEFKGGGKSRDSNKMGRRVSICGKRRPFCVAMAAFLRTDFR